MHYHAHIARFHHNTRQALDNGLVTDLILAGIESLGG